MRLLLCGLLVVLLAGCGTAQAAMVATVIPATATPPAPTATVPPTIPTPTASTYSAIDAIPTVVNEAATICQMAPNDVAGNVLAVQDALDAHGISYRTADQSIAILNWVISQRENGGATCPSIFQRAFTIILQESS